MTQQRELVLEVNESVVDRTVQIGRLVITPLVSADYWAFRVQLGHGQAIQGFPKFATIGIGFAEEEDWNTNLPCCVDTTELWEHIRHNKRYDEIPDEDCLRAIALIQQAARPYVHAREGRTPETCPLCSERS